MGFNKLASKQQEKSTEINYEIVEHIGVLSQSGKWTKELNIISWNGNEPKYDIRAWDRTDESNPKMQKGITLTQEEINAIVSLGSEG